MLNAGYQGRIADTAGFARRNRVLLVAAPNGVPVDIALAALSFEERVIERATFFEFAPRCSLRTCSAEDLIVFKLFASRPQDLVDAESVAARQGRLLNWTYLGESLSPLAEAKGEPAILGRLERLRRTYAAG